MMKNKIIFVQFQLKYEILLFPNLKNVLRSRTSQLHNFFFDLMCFKAVFGPRFPSYVLEPTCKIGLDHSAY